MSDSANFEVVVASTEEQLRAACKVRVAAYDHHLPGFGQQMSNPDPIDYHQDSIVLVALDKATGQAAGTVRLVSNRAAPLLVERCMDLGTAFAGLRMAEVTRLAVDPHYPDPNVRPCVMKALWMVSIAMQFSYCIVSARSTALVRTYLSMGFVQLTQPEEPVTLPHVGNLAHHVLALDMLAAPMHLKRRRHPLFETVQAHTPHIRLWAPGTAPTTPVRALAAA